ncbi:MAG: PKD domain-containing protein, partial [Flavobacteriales bacterium]|nr:PKD domain-containing protein [Flavobacteriales bacterium]
NLLGNLGEAYRGEIVLDAADNMVVASFTSSPDFPTTPGAYQSVFGGFQDGVVFAVDPTCSTLLYSSFIGGNLEDGSFGLRIADSGDLLVVGQTRSLDFPTTPDSHQPAFQGDRDGFVMRLAPDAAALVAATYLGTAEEDRAYLIDTDSHGDVWIYGQTGGAMPIQPEGTFGEPEGTGGLFLAKLSAALDSALITTKIGGTLFASVPVAFALDRCDNVYISGYNSAAGLPTTPNRFYATGSFYVASFHPDMSGQQFGTYYGGSHVDGGTSRFNKQGVIYQGVCGGPGSLQTTPWAWATEQTTTWDMGVLKMDLTENGLDAVSAEIPIDALDACSTVQVDFPNVSTGNAWYWDFGDGSPVAEGFEASHAYATAGTYTVQLTAVDSLTCNIADTDVLTVTVLVRPTAGTDAAVEVCANAAAFLLVDSLGGFPDAGGIWSLGGDPHAGLFEPAEDVDGSYCYTVTAAPCPADVACVTVSFIAPEDPRCISLSVPERETSIALWP